MTMQTDRTSLSYIAGILVGHAVGVVALMAITERQWGDFELGVLVLLLFAAGVIWLASTNQPNPAYGRHHVIPSGPTLAEVNPAGIYMLMRKGS
jgi:hypothetical protein